MRPSRRRVSAGWRRSGSGREVLAPATISTDHPGFLAFVPGAPTKASVLFDLAISASSIYGGSWLEGAGAVWAENQVLAWLAELVGMPEEAGGVFVSGGTAGNLSALAVARHSAAARRGASPIRWQIAAADTAHSIDRLGGACDGRRRDLGAVGRARPPDGRRASGRARRRGARRTVRGRRERRRDQRRCRGRPCGRRRRLRVARGVVPRRRRLRRRGLARPVGPAPVRGDRARRLVHRRPAQVVVRAVRCLRAAVPRPRSRSHGARPAGLLPRLSERSGGVERRATTRTI